MKIAFVIASLLLPFPLAAQQHANVGEKVPDTTFPTFQNGDGRQSLSEFFGQPVMIDRWGTRCGPCIGGAVPSAIKHDHELSDKGLVTILVESQGADEAKLEHFMWKTFPDNRCFSSVGTSVPLPPSNGIPHGGLIGVDGTLLWAGNPLEAPQKIDELIEAELTKVKKGWGPTADSRKVRAALYGKGDLAGASALVAAMPEGEERTGLQAEVDARYASRKKAIGTLQQRGHWVDAQAAAKDLQKAVGTHATWAGEVAPMVAEFDTATNKAEIALDKKLEKIEKQLRDKKLEQAQKALDDFVKSAEQSSVGQRAARMLKALQTPLE